MAEWLNVTFFNFDFSVAKAFNVLAERFGDVLTPFSELLALLGIGAIITNVAIKNIVARPRPYQELDSFRLFWMSVGSHVESEYSFPSGHATVSFTSMTAVYLCFNKKWSWLGYVYAILTGLSRIYLVVHYATDVIGGCLVGILAGNSAYFFTKGIYKLLEKGKDKAFCKKFLEFSVCDLIAKKKTN